MAETLAKCAWCSGTGKGDEYKPICVVCKGSGLVKVVTGEDNKPIPCARCGGAGKERDSGDLCTVCDGSGWAGRVRKPRE